METRGRVLNELSCEPLEKVILLCSDLYKGRNSEDREETNEAYVT